MTCAIRHTQYLIRRNCAMSNHRRRFFFILCLLFTTLLIFLDNIYFGHKWQLCSTTDTQSENSDFEKYHSENFTVTNVVDGDTLDINYPDSTKKYTRVRLLGIDALEIHSESSPEYYGLQVFDFVKQSVAGQVVTIYLDEGNDTRGKYGRLLAYVKLPDGRFLNEVMLSEGFAYADTRFRHSFYNKYNQLQSRARTSKKGLWKNITPEQMPDWLQ